MALAPQRAHLVESLLVDAATQAPLASPAVCDSMPTQAAKLRIAFWVGAAHLSLTPLGVLRVSTWQALVFITASCLPDRGNASETLLPASSMERPGGGPDVANGLINVDLFGHHT